MHGHKIEYYVRTVGQGFQRKEGGPCIAKDSIEGYSPG